MLLCWCIIFGVHWDAKPFFKRSRLLGPWERDHMRAQSQWGKFPHSAEERLVVRAEEWEHATAAGALFRVECKIVEVASDGKSTILQNTGSEWLQSPQLFCIPDRKVWMREEGDGRKDIPLGSDTMTFFGRSVRLLFRYKIWTRDD